MGIEVLWVSGWPFEGGGVDGRNVNAGTGSSGVYLWSLKYARNRRLINTTIGGFKEYEINLGKQV